MLDPDRVESDLGSIPGLGLIDFDVTFHPHKTLARRSYTPTQENPLAAAGSVVGYDVPHCGDVSYGTSTPAFVHDQGVDGVVDAGRSILGSFIHDVFSNPLFTREFINLVRRNKGLALTGPLPARAGMDDSYEQLAAALDRLAIF